MFPIRDKRGRVIGFGGRVLGDALPKYLNSPETDIFHKGRQLYGLYEAQQDNPEPPRLLVVEGYMDPYTLRQPANAVVRGYPAALHTGHTAGGLYGICRFPGSSDTSAGHRPAPVRQTQSPGLAYRGWGTSPVRFINSL